MPIYCLEIYTMNNWVTLRLDELYKTNKVAKNLEQLKGLITRTCQRGVQANKNQIEEGEHLYKGLLLTPAEFQNYKRLSETVESWTFPGPMTVTDEDTAAMR